MQGWISLHRKILDNPIVCKDSDYFSVWCYLLLNATHDTYDAEFKGKRISLEAGQLITGRKSIAKQFNLTESKVQRILKKLENEQQIEQQTSNKNRLVTVLNWSSYQQGERQVEQPLNNKRTTSEQQVNTNNNVDNEIIKDIVDYLNQKGGKNYKASTAKTKKHINARLADGFSVDDIKQVINTKCNEWLGTEQEKYIRPETLFGTKFEGYLNQEPRRKKETAPKFDRSKVVYRDL